jgi:3'-phosphoadenosine 5'-phosphosulfate sulfotransferase (PAPS reductase)/FAD synthetase
MTPEIKNLIDRKALFVINHSGGKDSQAMFIRLLEIVPREQLLVVHASLGRIEWHGALELAQKQAADANVPFIVARANWADGSSKDFLNMAEHRFDIRPDVPSFASSQRRQCTSDLKRGPIEREILRHMKAHGLKLVVNCEGIRGDESRDRAKYNPFVHLNNDLDKNGKTKHSLARAGREAYSWLPIFTLNTAEVFATIAAAGQQPHYAYAQGNERLSCVFCIMGSKNDIYRGAIARPELFAEYVAMEEHTGYTMHMSRKSLKQIVEEAAGEIALAA